MDFTVHPSSELTLGLERTADAADAYDLVRLDAGGQALARHVLPRPATFQLPTLRRLFPLRPFG